MGEWSNLTQREKSNIIRFAIKNGVSDINQIRDTFNVYVKDSLANVDYNMAAAKASGFGSNGNGHYPDTFKKPNHPTFSDESIYHSEATPGGRWIGNTYEPSEFVLNQQGGWNQFLRSFYNQEQGTGAVPVFNGGVMLPEVTVTPQYKEGGKIYIKPSKRGTFTAAAKKHGKSVQEFARQVLANKENYSPAMIRKAVFAHNSKSWKHSTGGPLYPFSFQKNPYWKTPVVRYDNGGNMWGNDLALNRATTVHSNYEDAKDLSIPSWRLPIQKKLFSWGLPSALSNCTLTATQWVDPTNPIMSARNIFNNPKLGYTEINAEDAIPGDLLIAKNPKEGTYHTMMIEGFDSTNQPILRYSKGGAGEENLRTGMTLSGYHAADIEQEGNHTEDHYFRYNYPNEFRLPEIIVTASKK